MKKLILFAGMIVLASCIVGVTGCSNSGDSGVTQADMDKGQKALPPDDGKGPGLYGGARAPDSGAGPKKGK